jgi:hypothetical protein
LVSQNGEIKGPFDLDMIEAFILSGHYPKNIQICAEGSNQWRSHSPTVETPHAARPTAATASPVTASPSGGIAKWKIVLGALVGLWILGKMLGGGSTATPAKSTRTTPAATPYSFATSTNSTLSATPFSTSFTLAPASFPRPASHSTPRTYYPPPAAAATPANVLYTGANGRTYSVPHSDYLRLSRQKEALDQEDVVVTAVQTRLDAEQASLEQQRAYLDRTNQYEIDDFNQKINAFNTKKSQVGRQIATFNGHVDSFNAELARVGTLVH